MISFLPFLTPKQSMYSCSLPCVPHVPPTSVSLSSTCQYYSANSTNLEAHRYSVFSNLVQLPPSSVPIFSWSQIQGHRKLVRVPLTNFQEVAECLGLGMKGFICIQQIMLLERQERVQHNRALSPFRTAGFWQFAPPPLPPPTSVLKIAAFVPVLSSEQKVKSRTDSPYSSQI